MKLPQFMRRKTKVNCSNCGKMKPIEECAFYEGMQVFICKECSQKVNLFK